MKANKCIFLLIPLLLTSCNTEQINNDNGENNNDSNCIIKEKTTINFLSMSDSGYHDELVNMIQSFESEEPNVKVNIYNPLGSGNYNMLEKYVVAGFFKEDYPDLVQCYPDNVIKYIAQEKAINLDPYINNKVYGLTEEERSDYITSFIQEGRNYHKDGTYSLPFCKSTELLYYNADVLEGLDLSSVDNSINEGKALDVNYLDNLTWEELFNKLCPALKTYNDAQDSSHKIYVDSDTSAIFTYDSDENFFITLAKQYGYGYTSLDSTLKGVIEFNNPNMKNLMKTLKTAKDNKYLLTRGSNSGNYVSYMFTDKKALFTISSTAGLAYNYNEVNPFRIGAAKIPHAENHDYLAINQGPSLCILDHYDDNRSLASFLLWKHLTNEKNSSSWALQTGYMGVRNSSYKTEEYNAAKSITDKSNLLKLATASNLNKISEVRDYTFNTPVFRGSSNVRTNVGLLLKDCLNSENLDSEIDELFAYYTSDAESYIKENY